MMDLSILLPNPDAVTLIDVTLAAHNRQHGEPEYSVGAAAILRAREKHDMYNRTFDFSSDAVRLEVFAIGTSGALHREGRQFLCSHATATDLHNPGLQFSNILKTLSVAVQTARAKCVIIARATSRWIRPPSFPSLMVSFLYHLPSVSLYLLYMRVMML